MVDAHTWWRMGDRSYSAATVEQLAQEMAAHDIAWLEEPLPPDDHAAYLALKEKDLVPLASGEHEPNEERYLDLILTRAVDYVQMDVCCQGGYSLGRRLFAEIARQGLRFAFHSWGTALEVVAAAQLGVCWPQMVVEWLEYPCYSAPGRAGMYPFPLAAEILTEPLEIERGEPDCAAEAGARGDGGRAGDRAVPVDSGAVVAVPHRFAGGDARGDERSQRAVGCGGEVAGAEGESSPVKRRLKAGCSHDWLPHRVAGCVASRYNGSMSDKLTIAGREFASRLIVGTGKYRSFQEMMRCHEASGADMVTVAVRRVNLTDRTKESLIDFIDRTKIFILPNTAACYTADDAVRTALLAREVGLSNWVKLEVIGDEKTLFPDNAGLLEATKILVKEGFVVLPYTNDDVVNARRLIDAGAAAVMPLAAPIGSGLGVQNPVNLRIFREMITEVPMIVDAGVGTASDAAIAMELGADGVLMNTAIAAADDSVKMARAMKLSVEAGRLAWEAGRMPRKLYASASSPLAGVVGSS